MKNKGEIGEIEKIYQKKTQLEHILLRPDTYIGTIEHIDEKLWVYDQKTSKLVYKSINYVPGLYKIFDEILVNAVDNITRDLAMNTIKVDIDKKSVTVYNNGKGIPIKIHNTEKVYVPELIFGHLLTGSNFDDSIKKIVGGRNGFGAKLTNVFSKKFIIQTGEKKNRKMFRIEFTNNMTKHSEPIISKYEGEDFTKVYFEPDFKKFRMTEIDEDIMSLLMKRVYDVAGTTPARINVYLNGKKINVKTFNDYIDLYLKDRYYDEANKIEFPKLVVPSKERWEVAFSMADASFQQVSFVNGICTSKGGTHVNYIIDQVTERVGEHIKKKYKDIKMNSNQIKQNLWVFINCLIENPSFDSQTKENLTTKPNQFGSTFELTEKFFKELLKSNIVTNIVDFAKAKQKVKLHKALSSNIKKSSRLLGIDKLEDANLAGTKDYKECTLILTEGDSAKALALAGIEVVGRERYGVFPLRGKLLNVRCAKDNQIMNNEEIQNIIKILGLKMNMDYSDELKGMRYGHLLIMADQDFDGSHIKGLIINFIHYFWPSLLKRGDFLHEFITPIVKASKPGAKDLVFFTIKEYNDWYLQNKKNGYKIKYYKGLGTSTTKEAKEYFSNIKRNKIDFYYINREDDESIEMGFSKTDTEARKEWLMNFDQFNTFIDHSKGVVRYKDFVNKELIFFSNYDNIRSIPSVMDGLKPSERKILYSCFKRNLRNELKVAQLSGYVAEHSSYHHGEQSLAATITAMAQDFVGSNNFNVLLPIGQFGSRYNGSKGAASPRYIFTALNPLTRKLYHEEDDNLLLYNVDEGMKIEPVWYAPIIPSVLINGSEGIGTGWSTSIPQYNPLDIAKNLIRKMNNEPYEDMIPWYKGYTGEIKETVGGKNQNGSKLYSVTGRIKIGEDKTVEITELPIHVWTRDYKTFLEKNHIDNKENQNSKKDFEVEDIKEYHTDNKLSFVVTLTENSFEKVKQLSNDELVKIFKLSTTISTTNMVLFDSKNKIKKYANVNDIMDEFYEVRLQYYEKRKEYLLAKIGFSLSKNQAKRDFINLVLSNEIPFKSKNKEEIFKILKDKQIPTLSELKKKYAKAFAINSTEVIIESNEDNEPREIDENDFDYDYLMNMNIWSLTSAKVKELNDNIDKDKEQYDFLEKNPVINLWNLDIEEFTLLYQKLIDEIEGKNTEIDKKIKTMKSRAISMKKGKRVNGTKKKGGKKTKKNEDSFLDDDESEGSDDEDEYSEYSDSEDDSSKKNNKKNGKTNKKKVSSKLSSSKDENEINIKENEESEEEEEEKVNTKKSKSKATKTSTSASKKKNSTSKKSGSKQKEESKEEEDVNPVTKNLLKILQVDSKNVPKGDASNIDMSKLSLKERLALRAKQGKIEEYFTALNKKEEIKVNDEDDLKDATNENNINDFLQKKTQPEKRKRLVKGSSSKKKKVINDSDDDGDEDYEMN